MADASAPSQSQSQTPEYRDTAAAQIRSLSALNARIPFILTTSATTISQLTNAPIHPPSTAAPTDSPALRRAALSSSSNDFFSLVLDLHKALHEQINELEKQGVIPADAVRYVAPLSTKQQGPLGAAGHGHEIEHKDSEATVTNGGLGDFDVGVLNARAGVRQRDVDEVLERVKNVLEEWQKKSEGAEDDEMGVDG